MGPERFSLVGRTALVTGATGYLGAAIAFALAEAGAHVFINSRFAERSTSLAAKLRQAGLSAEAAAFDVRSEEEVGVFFSGRTESPLHVLVNNAYAGGAGSIERADAESYRASYDLVVTAAHRLLRAALPSLRHGVGLHGDASVINIASMYALVSPDQRVYHDSASANPPFYGAAKAALVQWTRYAACEFGPQGIRVNAISPGPFPSDDVQAGNPILVERLVSKVPMGRIGVAEEIAGPVLFLASAASSFVNGANIVVDGGWTCW